MKCATPVGPVGMAVRALALALTVAGTAAMGGCATNPATGQSSFTGLTSTESEARTGREMHPQVVREFGGGQNNIFVVGDEDQAIYGFRGADYRNVLQFRKDFPAAKVILLEQNYRSTQIVLDAARAVIDKNNHRTPKSLFTEQRGGSRVIVFEAYSDSDEADFVVKTVEQIKRREGLEYKDFAVMYRTNAQSRALEEACIRDSIPYKLVGGVGFYKRREIRDLLAYLRLINNGDDSVSFNRIINVPKRGIGKKSVEDFQSWASKQRLSYAAALEALANGEASTLGASTVKKFIEFYQLLSDWRELTKAGDLAVVSQDRHHGPSWPGPCCAG